MSNNLVGQKIWLIGASTGIGEALAYALDAAGAHVAVSARSRDKIEALAMQLKSSQKLAVPVDVTRAETVASAWAEINAAWGGIDILIYNAGAYDPINGADFDLAKIEQIVDVNFNGALRALSPVIPAFISRRGGQIVLVASAAAYRGLPNAIGYGASKAALLHLAENLRLDLSRYAIKVQVVMPGFVKTRLTDKNAFKMPFMISADVAAQRIVAGMRGDGFEIDFPKRFTLILKCLRCLPYALYFRLLKNL